MEHHLVLRIIAKLLIPLILLFGLYVQFHGDYGPGGGFQAGVIFASGFVLYSLIFGIDNIRKVVHPSWIRSLAAVGLLLYVAVGLVCMVNGGNFLSYNFLSENNIDGQHLGIFLIELGVGMTVASTMIMLFYVFARP